MAKKIIIYKGPIYRVFSNGIILDKNGIVPNMGKEKVCEDELFYGLYGSYVNMSYDCILADEYEAIDFVKSAIKRNSEMLKKLYQKCQGEDNGLEEFKQYVKVLSNCVYFDPDEIERSHSLPRSEFKKLKKQTKIRNS